MRVLAISEMDMLDRFSHSQVQSCRRCRMPSSEVPGKILVVVGVLPKQGEGTIDGFRGL